MRVSLHSLVVTFGVALLLTGCETNLGPDPEVVGRLASFFEEVTFGGPYDSDVQQKKHLIKWASPVRVELEGSDPETYRTVVETQLTRFSNITGISATVLATEDYGANLVISFVPEKDFLLRKDFVPCFAGVKETEGVIESVQVVISTFDESKIESCLGHELMHAFGLRFHSGIVASILSPAHQQTDLSRWDELALKVLYHGRLESGLSERQAMQIVPGLLTEALSD